MEQTSKDISLRTILHQYFKENLTVLPADFYLAQYNMVRKFLMAVSKEGKSETENPSHTLETPDRVYRYFFDETKPNGSELVVSATKKDSEGEIVNTHIEVISKKNLREFIVTKLDPLTTIIHNHKEFPSVSVEKWSNFMEQLQRVDGFWEQYGMPNRWKEVLDFIVEKLDGDWNRLFTSHSVNQVYAGKDGITIKNETTEKALYPFTTFKYRKDSDATFILKIYTAYIVEKDGHKSGGYEEYEERFGVPNEARQLLSILTRRSGQPVSEGSVSICI